MLIHKFNQYTNMVTDEQYFMHEISNYCLLDILLIAFPAEHCVCMLIVRRFILSGSFTGDCDIKMSSPALVQINMKHIRTYSNQALLKPKWNRQNRRSCYYDCSMWYSVILACCVVFRLCHFNRLLMLPMSWWHSCCGPLYIWHIKSYHTKQNGLTSLKQLIYHDTEIVLWVSASKKARERDAIINVKITLQPVRILLDLESIWIFRLGVLKCFIHCLGCNFNITYPTHTHTHMTFVLLPLHNAHISHTYTRCHDSFFFASMNSFPFVLDDFLWFRFAFSPYRFVACLDTHFWYHLFMWVCVCCVFVVSD